MTRLTAVDLFAGAGGLSLAAHMAGLDVVFAIESDKWAAETYRFNLVSKAKAGELYEVDIQKLNPKALAARHFRVDDQVDLVLGGPPCQGFSTHRLKSSGVKDIRNSLINDYFAFVRALKPRMFLMENVPGLLWPRHKARMDEFYRKGARAGYHLYSPQILDARDYGVPQRRKRVFILGVRQSFERECLSWPPAPTHRNPKTTEPDGREEWIACELAFRRTGDGDINDQGMTHSPEIVEVFKNTPQNGGSRHQSGRVLACHVGHDGHKDVYGRIDPRVPAPTMTTACINPSKGRFVHPTQNHGITARQAARIQTFPDDFIFQGGLTAAGRQIGNAVPIKLGEHVIQHIVSYLNHLDERKKRDTTIISEAA